MTSLERLLEVSRVSFSWKIHERSQASAVLNRISFGLDSREVKAVLGPNGSGKSTLFKLLSGLNSPRAGQFSGEVRSKGRDLFAMTCRERSQFISYLGADFNSEFPLSVQDAVTLGRLYAEGTHSDHTGSVELALESCFCAHLRDRDLRSLSGGQRQLVGLARCLAQAPHVLVLDESLSKMDLDHQYRVTEMLKEWVKVKNSAVLWVTHDLNLAFNFASGVLWLRGGEKIGEGSPSEMLNDEMLKKIYPGAIFPSQKNMVIPSW